MNYKKILVLLSISLGISAFTSCQTNSNAYTVRVTVTVDTNSLLILSIENPTTHIVLFDDPRLGRSARFDWELSAGQEIVARGGEGREVRDPLLAGHISTGPVDVGPERPFKCSLDKYYPELGNGHLISSADALLWYCRLWDATSTNWVQASGTVRLK